jgi:hypothetical protein
MRNSHFRMVEPLEGRRLLSDLALSIDESVSNITAAGTVNSVPLSASNSGSLTGALGGTLNVSSTKAGIKFLSGSEVTVTPSDGSGAPFSFTVAGTTVDVADPAFAFTSGRLKSTGGKFSVANVGASLSDGTIDVTGLPAAADLTGATATINYAVGRVKKSDSSIRITMPYSFNVTANYTLASVPQALDVTFTGLLVARGEFADGSAFVPKVPAAAVTKRDRVASGVLDEAA